MPRKCKDVADNGRKRKRSYRAYDENVLMKAIALIKAKKISINLASTKFAIPKGTLINKLHQKHTKSVGSPLVLSDIEEKVIIEHISTVGEWGFPFCKNDLRYLVKHYLDKCERKVFQFNDNLPTRQWAARFLKRHKTETSEKKCQNLKRSKAQLNAEDLKKYFDNLQATLTEEDGSLVPPHRIFNFDETNLSDDPGAKKCIFKRGTKYPERIMDHSKSSTSVMYCGSAAGDILPPYVVYKSTHLYKSWMEGGPAHTRYNRSKSGWFDGVIFQDWFTQMFLPYVRKHKLNDEGKVVLIGDNLSSHFSSEVLQLCRDNNIAFVCLPKNSTHMTQPLDVAFYRPLKTFWRALLESWKMKQRKMQTVTKEMFPSLLNDLHKKLVDESNKSKNLIAGFKKCGVYPFDPNEVISRLPEIKANVDKTEHVSEAVLEMLKELRSEDKTRKIQRRTKISVEPGKSIGLEDLEKVEEQERVSVEPKKKGKRAVVKKRKSEIEIEDSAVGGGEDHHGDNKNRNKKRKKEPTKKKKKLEDDTIDKDWCDADLKGKSQTKKTQNEKTRIVKRMVKDVAESHDDHRTGTSDNETSDNETSDTGSDEEQLADSICSQEIRPSISEIHLGDYIIVEYLLPQSKKYFVGLVKKLSKDILHVAFLIKSGMSFVNPSVSSNESIVLPTQVVKILPSPSKKQRGKLMFSKEATQGFSFEKY